MCFEVKLFSVEKIKKLKIKNKKKKPGTIQENFSVCNEVNPEGKRYTLQCTKHLLATWSLHFTLKSRKSDERGTGRQKWSSQKDQEKVALGMRAVKKQRMREAALGKFLFLYAVVCSLPFCQSLRHAELWLSKQPNKNLLETSDGLSRWPLVFSGIL